jgi:twitching motility protein PilI
MNSSALAIPFTSNQKPVGDAYLKFQLDEQTQAVFSMKYVQEVLTLPARRLTPMPNMPASMLGLMNRRSRVLWLIDLAQILGLSVLDTNVQQYTLILIQVNAVSLGLAIQQVEGITRIPTDAIQPLTGQVSPALLPYVRGCVLQSQDHKQEMLLVLDAEAVLQSPVLCQS